MTVTAIPQQNAEGAAKGAAPEPEQPKGSKKKKLIIILVAVLLLGGGGYYKFVMSAPKGPVKPEEGAVLKQDPVQINLSGGHYLRMGIVLQLTKEASAEVEGSKALDIAIDFFTGRNIEEVNSPEPRRKLKEELAKKIESAYKGEVMDIYFAEFVTQ